MTGWPAMPSLDIVIRSFYRDQRWLALALQSIECYVTGYRHVVVILPRASLSRIDPSLYSTNPDVRVHSCQDYPDDYLGQQITKLHADSYTDAEVILHLDSDQVFTAPCNLRARLFDGDRLRVTFDPSGRRPVSDGWRKCPALFLRQPVPVDLAVPLPLALPRDVYPAVRELCAHTHGVSITEYAVAAGADRFCELSLLRAIAFTREPGRYVWVDASQHELVPECRTFWSRAQTPAEVASQLPEALGARITGA